MKVIGAGMPKTGTKTLHAALEILGYSVYDFPENGIMLYKNYEKIVCEGWTTEDFRNMYENVDAIVDNPAYFFWDEIHMAFPDAKVILSVRDSEEQWVKSMTKQLQIMDKNFLMRTMFLLSPTMIKTHKYMARLGQVALGISPQSNFRLKSALNVPLLKKLYRAHNAYVKHCTPEDKLLVYNCSEGWGPLCEFLGVPVPDQPFPHKNVGGNIVNTITKESQIMAGIQREVITSAVTITIGAVCGGMLLHKYGFTGILSTLRGVGEKAFQKLGY